MASAQDLRTEMLIKLMMNSLEPMAEKAARAGFSPMNFHAFKTGLLGQLANFLANNESLLTFFETGLEGAVLLLFPSMPNAYKVALHDLLDMATDGLRQSLREKDDKKAELKISETNSNFKKGMKGILDEAVKAAAVKPSYTKLVMSLTAAQRDDHMGWVHWMSEQSDKGDYNEFLGMKNLISSKEELEELLHQAGGDWSATTRRRMAFLRAMYTEDESIAQTALASIQGKETPQTRALRAKVKDFETKAAAFAVDQKAKRQKIIDDNRIVPKEIADEIGRIHWGWKVAAGAVAFLLVLSFVYSVIF